MGPLLNPCNVKKQLIGVYNKDITELIAQTMQKKGITHGIVVNGNGLDEITIDGETQITELKNNIIKTYNIHPKQYGIKKSSISGLIVNSKEESANVIMSVLNDEDTSARDIVILNSAAAIYLGGKAKSIKEGINKAKESISLGEALKSLNRLKEILK
jgi:anthranilate phosphoribosyltransferase